MEELIDYFEESEREKFLSMYKINKIVGSGGFGVVLAAVDLQYRKHVALKIVYKADLKGEMLRYEYEILRELTHSNIIKIYQLTNFQNFLMMSMKLTRENLSEYHK